MVQSKSPGNRIKKKNKNKEKQKKLAVIFGLIWIIKSVHWLEGFYILWLIGADFFQVISGFSRQLASISR